MKKADILFGAVVLLLCAVWLGAGHFLRTDGASVEIMRDGQSCGTYDLSKDQEIDIGSGNRLTIRDGAAQMTYADCPDQICVRQGRVSARGETITCLPNRVVVRVTGGGPEDEAAPDAVAW